MASESSIPITQTNVVAPTPQNTPLNQAPLAAGLSRPTVPDINEEEESDLEDGDGETGGLPAGAKEMMLSMVQGRLAGLMGKSSGYIEGLPVETKRNVEALKGVQAKQDELHHQYKLECLELEKKYLSLATPLYERRQAIITGSTKPTLAEIEAGEAVSLKDDEDYKPLPKVTSESELVSSGIPEFWLTALRNHLGLSEMISDRDAEALKSLIDIKISYPTEAPGFKITFVFKENDYFEGTILEKTYVYAEEVGYSGDFIFDKAIGTEIKWKEDKDLTKEFEIRKQRNKNTNRTRLVRKAKPIESFFNFFTPPVVPEEDDSDLEEEELEELEDRVELDYQIGEDFKEKIIPKAIDFFTGKALEYEIDDEDDEDEDDYEDEDDEDEDEDEDEDGVPTKRRNKRITSSSINAAGGKVDTEECKQQ